MAKLSILFICRILKWVWKSLNHVLGIRVWAFYTYVAVGCRDWRRKLRVLSHQNLSDTTVSTVQWSMPRDMVARHQRIPRIENIFGQLLHHVCRPRGRRRLAPFTSQTKGQLESKSTGTAWARFRMQSAVAV